MPTEKYGYDHDSHPLISFKRLPESLIALRTELAKPQHRDIYDEAEKEATFEAALGTIAARLDIAVDGFIDVDDFSAVLCNALRRRHMFKDRPHLRDSRLVNAEMHEKGEEIELVKIPDNVPAIITPDGFPEKRDLVMITEKWTITGANREYLQFPRDNEFNVEKQAQRVLLASEAPKMWNYLQKVVETFKDPVNDEEAELQLKIKIFLTTLRIPLLNQP